MTIHVPLTDSEVVCLLISDARQLAAHALRAVRSMKCSCPPAGVGFGLCPRHEVELSARLVSGTTDTLIARMELAQALCAAALPLLEER